MAVKLRLQRCGSRQASKYRLVATDSRSPRDGKFIEKLGYYNPQARGQELPYSFDFERIEYWQSVGAQASDTVRALLKEARKAAPAA